jgi:hypothetical protein
VLYSVDVPRPPWVLRERVKIEKLEEEKRKKDKQGQLFKK